MVAVVVVVDVEAQPVDAQASQQLLKPPTHAVVPARAVQWLASRLILHRVPVGLVRQQVTKPAGLPQVEWEAHRLTVPAQLLLTSVALAWSAAQLT